MGSTSNGKCLNTYQRPVYQRNRRQSGQINEGELGGGGEEQLMGRNTGWEPRETDGSVGQRAISRFQYNPGWRENTYFWVSYPIFSILVPEMKLLDTYLSAGRIGNRLGALNSREKTVYDAPYRYLIPPAVGKCVLDLPGGQGIQNTPSGVWYLLHLSRHHKTRGE